jgi:hypothetical protein
MGLDVVGQNRDGDQVVGRNVEEALNLACVQIHGQHPVRAGPGDYIGHQLGGDRRAAAGFPVLPGIAEIGHDRGDPPRRRPLQGVDADQQLHQVVVGRIGGGLDDKDVLAADVLLDDDKHLVVGKAADLGLGQRQVQIVADGLGQHAVGIAGQQFHRTVIPQ